MQTILYFLFNMLRLQLSMHNIVKFGANIASDMFQNFILIIIFGIQPNMSLQGHKLASKYMVGPKIGSGSFGQIYVVNQIGTIQIFALKRQDEKNKHPQLPLEAKILKCLDGCQGFARIHWQGIQGKTNIVIMDMLGPTLEDLFELSDKKFSLKTTAMLADQMIQRIQSLHSRNFVHRDIKPQNFLMGILGQSHLVHLIDFGLSKKYRDQKTHQHIPYKENKSLTGTARYASINAHLGIQQSRRDDLEAIGYVLLYFMQGYLPWQGIKANNKNEKYQKIMQKKMSIPIQIQCDGLPLQFATYLNYCRSLKFEDKPDYIFLRKLFRDLLQNERQRYDYRYDWCNVKQNKNYTNGKIKIDLKASHEDEKIEDYLDQVIQKQETQQRNQMNKTKLNTLMRSNQQKLSINTEQHQLLQEESKCNDIDDIDDIDREQGNISDQIKQFSSDQQLGVRDMGDELDLEDKKNRMIFDEY